MPRRVSGAEAIPVFSNCNHMRSHFAPMALRSSSCAFRVKNSVGSLLKSPSSSIIRIMDVQMRYSIVPTVEVGRWRGVLANPVIGESPMRTASPLRQHKQGRCTLFRQFSQQPAAENAEGWSISKGARSMLNYWSSKPIEGETRGITDMYRKVNSEREKAKEEEVFANQVRSLLARPTFDLDDFLDQMKDGLELMGITPLKEQMPWVKNNAMYQELKNDIAVLEAMTPAERSNPQLVGPAQRKRVAEVLGLDTSVGAKQVARVMKNYSNARYLHRWLHSRQNDGKPIPTTPSEVQQMVQEEDGVGGAIQASAKRPSMKRMRRRRR